jgi:hypothetical protein
MNPGGVSVASGKPIPGDRLVVFSTAERTATDRDRLDRSGRQVL